MYGTQCNDIMSNIVFIRMFFTLFSNKNNYNKIRLTENWNTHFMSVCHIYFVVNLIFWNAIIENCLIGTHMCGTHSITQYQKYKHTASE